MPISLTPSASRALCFALLDVHGGAAVLEELVKAGVLEEVGHGDHRLTPEGAEALAAALALQTARCSCAHTRFQHSDASPHACEVCGECRSFTFERFTGAEEAVRCECGWLLPIGLQLLEEGPGRQPSDFTVSCGRCGLWWLFRTSGRGGWVRDDFKQAIASNRQASP